MVEDLIVYELGFASDKGGKDASRWLVGFGYATLASSTGFRFFTGRQDKRKKKTIKTKYICLVISFQIFIFGVNSEKFAFSRTATWLAIKKVRLDIGEWI